MALWKQLKLRNFQDKLTRNDTNHGTKVHRLLRLDGFTVRQFRLKRQNVLTGLSFLMCFTFCVLNLNQLL